MASERNYQAIAAQKSKNITSSMGLKPATKPTGIMQKFPATTAPSQARLAAINAGRATVTPTVNNNPPAYNPPAYNPPANNETNISALAPEATPMTAAAPEITEETLRKSTEFLARERALQAALDLFGANQATDLARYGEGYKRNLTNLGWRGDINDWDYGQLISQGERATESGKAFKALADDFAARGMLQSGAYQGARNILQNQLNERRTALEEGQKNFAEDQQKARTAFLAEQENARSQALTDARAALLAQMGV